MVTITGKGSVIVSEPVNSDWRSKAKRHHRTYSAAASALGIYPSSATFYAAMRVLGYTHFYDVDKAVARGLIQLAEPTKRGRRRIDISSLIDAGVTHQAILEAEEEYTRLNRDSYRRRIARAQHRKEITNA